LTRERPASADAPLNRFAVRLAAAVVVGIALASGAASGAQATPAKGYEQPLNPHEAIAFGKMKIPRWLVESVVAASRETDMDPAYIMALADKESSFLPDSKARTSSAEGLFQFLETTWLEVLKTHGAKHGFGAAADAISVSGGRYSVADPEDRKWILNLRRDPYLSALMAGEMANRSRGRLEQEADRAPTEGELYLAHFLGLNGAARLMKLIGEKPDEKAPKVFPSAAKANKAIFYSQEAKKKKDSTVAEVHARIGAMIETRLERYQDVASNLPKASPSLPTPALPPLASDATRVASSDDR
jgi:hypothetical protein